MRIVSIELHELVRLVSHKLEWPAPDSGVRPECVGAQIRRGRTTEDMLRLVPASLREAAAALGSPRWKMIVQVAYRAAAQGMVTGVLLAIARISGETAPLLFTALNNQFWSANLNAPLANVPVVIFQYAMSPYDEWHALAWAGAFVLTAFVLALNLFVRLLARKGMKK